MSVRRHKPTSISAPNSFWEQVEEEARASSQSVSGTIVNIVSNYFRSKITRLSSWDTDDEEWYDENKFYTYSQDKYGHSAKVEVTIPKHIAGEVKGIIDAGKIPELRTTQDFYRNAIRHEAHRIGKMIQDEGLIEAAHLMTVQDDLMHEQVIATDAQKMMADARNLLDEALMLGHYDFIEGKLVSLWKASTSVNERFRSAYMQMLRDYRKNLDEYKERDTTKGTVKLPDGRVMKNGVELAPRRRRKSDTD